MARVQQLNKPKNTPSFDPGKTYKWDPNDTFELTGMQFASLYHCLTQDARNPGGAPVLMKMEAYNVVMDLFKQAVEQGIAKETVEDVDNQVGNLFNNK